MNRGLRLLAICLIPLLFCTLPRSAWAADATPLSPPTGLSMTLAKSTKALLEGAWTSASQFDIHLQATISGAPVTPEVEIQPVGTAFTGLANFTGTKITASGPATVSISGLQNGKQYHWQIRLTDTDGNASPWASPSTSGTPFDIGVDQTPPSRPVIASPTNPSPNRWYHNHIVAFSWSSRDTTSGIAGYSYALLRHAHVIQPGALFKGTSLRTSNLADGVWFLAVRSQDLAGNWGPTATFKVQLDRKPPQLIWLTAPGAHFNPYRGPTSVRFRFDKNASARLSLYRVGSKTPTRVYVYPHVQANKIITITWSGKTPHGQYVTRGYYYFAVRAVDRAANVVRWNAGGLFVNPERPGITVAGITLYPDSGKQIIVSLSQQRMWATEGDKILITTLVTTGNPALPTPAGSYHVMEKLHPFEFISPWPPGSPYYYAPSWTQYALLFRAGGYYLHDAPWRNVFGPGSNGPGQPGTDYGGSHGCINMPLSASTFLYNWAPIGTPVYVVQ